MPDAAGEGTVLARVLRRAKPGPAAASAQWRNLYPSSGQDAVGHRLAQHLQPGYLEAERPRPVNGSQREGCKRLLAKVNVVDAQVQQEAPLESVLSRGFFSGGSTSRILASELCSLKVNELLPLREGKAALSVSIALADEQGVEISAAGIDVAQQPAVEVARISGAGHLVTLAPAGL